MLLLKATHSNSFIHTRTVAAAMQGADQHITSSFGFSILPKDTSTCRPGESNQQNLISWISLFLVFMMSVMMGLLCQHVL